MATAMRWTADMVRALPEDGNRYEVVDGVLLVTPAPAWRHQAVITRLFIKLGNYLESLGRLDSLLTSPADISWAPNVLVQPDIFVVAPGKAIRDWTDVKDLLLTIEVLSPGTSRTDRGVKRRAYQRYGVATYWIVDLDASAVEVWNPGARAPRVVTDVLRWRGSADAPELAIVLSEVFARLS